MATKEIFLWDKYYSQYYAKDLEENKKEFLNRIKDLEIRDDDVWVVTLPKCGTTWMQELVWLVLHDFDFETAKTVFIEERGPFLETDFYFNEDLSRAFAPIEKLKSPRLIKTHLPLFLLPKQLVNGKGRIVYVFRNPADALVSMYHHLRKGGHEMDISLEDSIGNYIRDGVYTEQIFRHVADFYKIKDDSRIFYTSYDRMKNELSTVIQDMCNFLKKSITEAQMQQMLKHLSFEEMQNNSKVHLELTFNWLHQKVNKPYEETNFVRKGKINAYKEELNAQTAHELEHWINENLAKHNLKLQDLLLSNN